MRLIVTGGRDYNNKSDVWQALGDIHAATPITTLVHGACKTGLDRIATDWADSLGIPTDPHPANWTLYGRAAGPIRNQKMADLGADAYLAFPGNNGTSDMVRRAKTAGIKEAAK